MAAARDPTTSAEPSVASRGDTSAATRAVDAEWLAQAIEALKCAFRLLRYDLLSELPSPHLREFPGSEGSAEASRLLADYLTEAEKLFNLAAR